MEKGDSRLDNFKAKSYIFSCNKIVVAGFSGAGKTTFGKSLASQLSKIDDKAWSGIDLDEELFRLHKNSSEQHLGEVIERVGFEVFRKLENELLFKIINTCKTPFVLSLGGGAFGEMTVAGLKKHPEVLGVFLDVPFETCFERIKHDPVRPLAKLGREVLLALYLERSSLYELAQMHLTCLERASTEEIVEQFLCHFIENSHTKKH